MEVPRRPGYSLTVDRIAKSSLARDPTREIVYRITAGGDRIERYDYSKAFERVNALANALSALGVRRGDRIATLDWNTHWHYEAYFTAPMMGAVLHTVNVRLLQV